MIIDKKRGRGNRIFIRVQFLSIDGVEIEDLYEFNFLYKWLLLASS